MRALWLQDQQLSYRTDVPKAEPAANQALIRVHLAGICSTDLELVRGYYPFTGIPGHEFVGEVVSSPSDATWLGRRVVGEINIACGTCQTCLSGLPRHCEQRRTLGIHEWDGAFAEHLVLPLFNLHEVPAILPDQAAVFTEPAAAACEILEQVSLSSKDRVLVIGAGRLGQLVAQVLSITGCQMAVVARHKKQQDLLAEHDIQVISTSDISTHRYDVVVEATGSPQGFTLARQAVRPRGVIVLKSTYKGEVQADFSSLVVDEVTLVGSRCGPFEPALRWMADGKIDPLPLIDSNFQLEKGLEAFEHAAQPGVLKVLLSP